MFVYSRCKYSVHNVWHKIIIYDHRSSCFCLTEIKSVSLMFDRWSMIIVLYFVFYRDKYRVFNVQHNYHLWSSFFICVSARQKWDVNVRHIIYDHRSSCFHLTEMKTVSLMFNRWSMIIVLYFVFYRNKYRVLNVRQMIYDQHSSYVGIPDFLPCPYCLTYHLWLYFYMFVSSRVQ